MADEFDFFGGKALTLDKRSEKKERASMWDLLATTENRLSVPNVTQSKKQEHHTVLCGVLRMVETTELEGVRGVFLSAFS